MQDNAIPKESASDDVFSPRQSIAGYLLVAGPSMTDPRFGQTVLLMLEHDSHGAMGVIINKKFDGLTFQDLAEQLNLPGQAQMANLPLHFGGPVDAGRGFLIHSPDVLIDSSVPFDGYAVTTSTTMLTKIAADEGPKHTLFALGYAGWSAGQLEDELKRHDWLVLPTETALLFDTPVDQRWERSLTLNGITRSHLVFEGGRA